VLATGLPALNLEAHYQTFFTGVIVIGAVLLDMYRIRQAAEVRIETAADVFKASMAEKIAGMKKELASIKTGGNGKQAADIHGQIAAARSELKTTFARMKAEERAEQARIRAEEKAADHDFSEMLKEKTERQP
jgi:ribose transport system permease protein